jgi:hypothetical protein
MTMLQWRKSGRHAFGLAWWAVLALGSVQARAQYHVIVYRATSAGVIAAVEAARHGLHVLIIEPGRWIGGMTASGLGVVDRGDTPTITGLARTFFQKVCDQYYVAGSPYLTHCKALDFQYEKPPFRLEPHVAAAAFQAMLTAQPYAANITVKFNTDIVSLQKSGATILSATTVDGAVYDATLFIDGSYEGDLLKLAGVSFTVGREANAQYDEALNGWQTPLVTDYAFDPYRRAGDPTSGLLYGLQPAPGTLPAVGTADAEVMAYNYRLCLTDVAANAARFTTKPAGYSEAKTALLLRYLTTLAAHRKCDVNAIACIKLGDVLPLSDDHRLPNGKFDINNGGAVSTDFIGMSARYPDADAKTRTAIAALHKSWLQGLLYFMQQSPAAPAGLRQEFAPFGLCRDEFTDTGNWPHQIYVREARRMVGAYVVTEANMNRTVPAVDDPVAVISYPHDVHDTLRFAVQVGGSFAAPQFGLAIEGGSFVGLNNPFPVPYRALVPQASQATNLLETNALSASHSAYAPIRMEPEYMMLAHAAGAAAVLAVQNGTSVQAVNIAQLEATLASEGLVVDVPAILSVADQGAADGGREVDLVGQYPGVASQYAVSHGSLAYNACCWPDQASAATSACTPSGTAQSSVTATDINMIVTYGSASNPAYCAFRVIRHDPAVAAPVYSHAVYATLKAE